MTWREHSDTAKGWLFPAERDALYEYAKLAITEQTGVPLPVPATIVEIGGYCGKSAIALGAAVEEANNGSLVFSVDWHRGSPEMAPDRECHDPEMVGADGLFDSLPHFRRNIKAAGLENCVAPIVSASPRVGYRWTALIDLLFIDGAHDAIGVNADFDLWARHVVPGGYLIFHDATIPCIGEVAKRAESEGFEFVEQVESMRILRRAR